jgi:hypothetical protein
MSHASARTLMLVWTVYLFLTGTILLSPLGDLRWLQIVLAFGAILGSLGMLAFSFKDVR